MLSQRHRPRGRGGPHLQPAFLRPQAMHLTCLRQSSAQDPDSWRRSPDKQDAAHEDQVFHVFGRVNEVIGSLASFNRLERQQAYAPALRLQTLSTVSSFAKTRCRGWETPERPVCNCNGSGQLFPSCTSSPGAWWSPSRARRRGHLVRRFSFSGLSTEPHS